MRLPFIVLLQLILFTACAQPQTESEWLSENTSELKTTEGYDFSSIKKAIGNKRIIALGESTHGLGEFYAVKSELVRYLHEELGFEVLAMEGGLGDINLSYYDIDTISASNLRDYSVFQNFRAKEADPLFEQIKTKSNTKTPLHYAGYDTQFSSNYFLTKLQRLVEPIDQEMADSLFVRAYSFQKSFGAARNGDSIGYIKHRDIYINNSNAARQLLLDHRNELFEQKKVTQKEFSIMIRTLEMFSRSVDLTFAKRNEGYVLRDKLMSENLFWLIDEIYPTKKIIVWAHNAHIEKANLEGANIKWMGHFLKEKYKDDYYALGLFAYEGEVYQHWTQNTLPFKNDQDNAIEKKLTDTGKELTFLDLLKLEQLPENQWLFEPIDGYELENGGIISFIPTKRFDGVLNIKESGSPTYEH